ADAQGRVRHGLAAALARVHPGRRQAARGPEEAEGSVRLRQVRVRRPGESGAAAEREDHVAAEVGTQRGRRTGPEWPPLSTVSGCCSPYCSSRSYSSSGWDSCSRHPHRNWLDSLDRRRRPKSPATPPPAANEACAWLFLGRPVFKRTTFARTRSSAALRA